MTRIDTCVIDELGGELIVKSKRKARVKENIVARRLVEMAAAHGGVAYKVESTTTNGFADYVVVLGDAGHVGRPRVHLIETKASDGKRSGLQEKFRRDCLDRGVSVHCPSSVAEVDMMFVLWTRGLL